MEPDEVESKSRFSASTLKMSRLGTAEAALKKHHSKVGDRNGRLTLVDNPYQRSNAPDLLN